MEIIFHFRANKTHFHKKGCALGLILNVTVFGTWTWPIQLLVKIEGRIEGKVNSTILDSCDKHNKVYQTWKPK